MTTGRSIPPAASLEALDAFNTERRRQAARRDASAARRALEILGPRCNERARAVAEARIANPEAPWSEIAGNLGLTKDQAIGLFRRLVQRVPVYRALRDDEAYADYYR